MDIETSATFLENECYNKYGKTGKSFYFSQVASTVRWLSTTNLDELTDRLRTNTSSNMEDDIAEALTASTSVDQRPLETSKEEIYHNVCSATFVRTSPGQTSSGSMRLPSIPSFSEFINSTKTKDSQSNQSSQLPKCAEKKLDKRMRLQ